MEKKTSKLHKNVDICFSGDLEQTERAFIVLFWIKLCIFQFNTSILNYPEDLKHRTLKLRKNVNLCSSGDFERRNLVLSIELQILWLKYWDF